LTTKIQVDPQSELDRSVIADLALLSVDIETNPADGDRIFKIGVVRSDDHRAMTLSPRRTSLPDVVNTLNAFAMGVEYLVGHNLRRHDVPSLKAQMPGLSWLDLPVIDTLELSAIAFPANPYHRLVKGYKLVSDSRNDPERDAQVALQLLREELIALKEMNGSDPMWGALLHYLVTPNDPLSLLFDRIRLAQAPDGKAAAAIAQDRFEGLCCETHLQRLTDFDRKQVPIELETLAYALGWIRVSGGNSVLPPWVHRAMPEARKAITALRELDCGRTSCLYCKQQHNPEALLQTYFQKPTFRQTPAAPDGSSLQRAIVLAGLQRESILAILPTGGGKSICYQLPALTHYWRAGQLTVIVSPLQSLMKDQVDNLLAAGVTCAVTINGLLTPLERRAALDKIRLGDAGIVLVSPEQFRSRTFTEAIRLREIATWVFDEAHCLSKWGHDFRTDYLYVSRYIRENFSDRPVPIACFTATAKPDVIEDLTDHFKESLGIELKRFLGGHERTNLSYMVISAPKEQKAHRVVELLSQELSDGGAAVVFCGTRRAAELMAEMITAAKIPCESFHGGLPPDRKRDIQSRFLAGEIPVIAATNAFGMGVDKPDVRIVVHADIPGSLESYLQEAGRAGRDGGSARCALLFDESDVDAQFRLSASSQLTLRDFQALIKSLRNRVKRFQRDEIVISPKELLAETTGTTIDIDDRDASTKVTTAVAWLERSGFLRRNENNSKVYPASLRVGSLDEAMARLAKANLPQVHHQRYAAVITTLFSTQTPEGVSTDELMLDAGIPADACFKILHELERLGIVANDLGLTVRLRRGVAGASDTWMEKLVEMECALLDLMAESAPDADSDRSAQHLGVRAFCTDLRRRIGLSDTDQSVSPQSLRNCLRSLAESFGSGTERRSMMQVKGLGPDSLRVTLERSWSQIREICARRRAVAQVVLQRLLAELPTGARGASLIVECKSRDLFDAMDSDVELMGTIKDQAMALEHALLYLHENKVVELDKGRSVFRSAMTIQTDPDRLKQTFKKDDFEPLKEFYRERTLQTHVMHEYAKLGLVDAAKASALVNAYFTWPRKKFVKVFFEGRKDIYELATTRESFRRIVDDLGHPVQQHLVEAPEEGNHLVLAGPGSGKTRVIVHRIAYLLRVRRVAPESIIALAFNRSAAIEVRRRLFDLVGDDARGVTVLTYHAIALRLTGVSLAAADGRSDSVDFNRIIESATALLEGEVETLSDADEARDQLLQGYRFIFVDEYQDIDEQQYRLVSALAGRKNDDPNAKLSVMAVGDDDQNIYTFKGANVEFIRRFQSDYPGEVTYLVENFRSSQNIIAAANHVIQRGPDRMKVDHPIRIASRRLAEPPGGRWDAGGDEHGGRVRLIAAPIDPNLQAQVVHAEIARLQSLDPTIKLSDIAVLARTHRVLEPLRALCDLESIRYELVTPEGDKSRVPLMRSREGHRLAKILLARRSKLVQVKAVLRWVDCQRRIEPGNSYLDDLKEALSDLAGAASSARVAGSEVLDALHEAAMESRRGGRNGALRLSTAHRAKGLEFPHVIVLDCGDWSWNSEEERRVLYVAMTRAKQTLTVLRAETGRNSLLTDLESVDGVVDLLPTKRPTFRPDLSRRYFSLGPSEVDIGFAGRHDAGHSLHERIAAVKVGDAISLNERLLRSDHHLPIGRLAARTVVPHDVLHARVTGVMVRTRQQTPPEYQGTLHVDEWETVLAEVVFN
jgi:ATP-dependent DNA helicase RecQ